MNWRDSLDAAKARLLTIQSSTVKLPLQARSVVYGATAVFAVVTLLTLSNLLGWWLGSFSDISATKPRISRLLGYIEAAPQIESATAEIDLALTRVAIEDTGDTGRGGALLQQQLRQLAGRVGLTVVGSELKEPVQLGVGEAQGHLKSPAVPMISTSFSASISASPALFPEGMQAEALRRINRRLRNPDAATADHLSARVDVAAYRLSEPND